MDGVRTRVSRYYPIGLTLSPFISVWIYHESTISIITWFNRTNIYALLAGFETAMVRARAYYLKDLTTTVFMLLKR